MLILRAMKRRAKNFLKRALAEEKTQASSAVETHIQMSLYSCRLSALESRG
jgi:hypothetical protein